MRQRDFHRFRPQRTDLFDGILHHIRHRRAQAFRGKIFFGKTDPDTLQITGLCHGIRPAARRSRQRRAVHGVETGHHIQQDRRIFHILRHGTDLIQRGCKRHQTITGNTPVSRLYPGNAAERCRLTDGPAGIRTQRRRDKPRGHCRRRTAGGTTGNPVEIQRIAGTHEGTVFTAGPHGKFIHIQPPEGNETGRFQPCDRRTVKGGLHRLQQFGGTAAPFTLYGNTILDPHGNPVIGGQGFACRPAGIRLCRGGKHSGFINFQKSLHFAITGGHPGQTLFNNVRGGDLPGGKLFSKTFYGKIRHINSSPPPAEPAGL